MSAPLSTLLEAPELETARLRLRGHRLEDLADCSALWADARVTRLIRETPFTREETWARLLRYVGHWRLMGFGGWLVEEKATHKFLGEISFADFKRGMEPSLEGIPEIGWVFAHDAQGRGYATEAVEAVLQWGDAVLGARQTACIIAPENERSIRLAQRFGYRELLRTVYHEEPILLFMRDHPAGVAG